MLKTPDSARWLDDQRLSDRALAWAAQRASEAGAELRLRQMRQMHQQASDSGLFGQSFLWAMLAQKPSSATAQN